MVTRGSGDEDFDIADVVSRVDSRSPDSSANHGDLPARPEIPGDFDEYTSV
jgi:hypothetical protein